MPSYLFAPGAVLGGATVVHDPRRKETSDYRIMMRCAGNRIQACTSEFTLAPKMARRAFKDHSIRLGCPDCYPNLHKIGTVQKIMKVHSPKGTNIFGSNEPGTARAREIVEALKNPNLKFADFYTIADRFCVREPTVRNHYLRYIVLPKMKKLEKENLQLRAELGQLKGGEV